MRATLENWRAAPLDGRLRATLGFIEKLTLAPESVTASDARALRDAGVSDAAIEDAIHVCTLFNVYDRLADSLDFHIPDEKAFARMAVMLLKRGYE